MDENIVMMIKQSKKIIELLEKDREDITLYLQGELCNAYRETLTFEISVIDRIKQNLEKINTI